MKLLYVLITFFFLALQTKTYAMSFVDKGGKESPFDPCTVEKLCYLNDFSAETFPWKPEACLNYEEVFKNYSYFEARSDCKNNAMTVLKFQQGKEVSRTEYIVNQKKLELRQK